MPALERALAALQASLGAERASAIVRRLIHIPGALEWLEDEPVRTALHAAVATGSPLPATALLATTGQRELAAPVDDLPGPLAARRQTLLSGEAGDEGLTPDDILLLGGELLRADRSGGAAAVTDLVKSAAVDWRAPLAVAWSGLSDREGLSARLVADGGSDHLTALLCALRSNFEDEQAASALAAAAGTRVNRLLARVVEHGEAAFASRMAEAADRADGAAPQRDEDAELSPSSLRRRLQESWEVRRGELASLTDALAEAAAFDGDPVSALQAREQALQLGPSDGRLANVAISVAEKGDASAALSLLPDSPESSSLGLAAGMAYLKGGAIEKGRAVLVRSAIEALDGGSPRPSAALATALMSSGEPALALEIYRALLGDHPSDEALRTEFAKALVASGDFEGALAEARTLRTIDPDSTPALAVEAESLRRLGRARESLDLLKDLPLGESGLWQTAVEAAIEAAQPEQVERLLSRPPSDVHSADLSVLRARSAAAAGRHPEAVELLESAVTQHPSEASLWIALAGLRADSKDVDASLDALRRGAQMIPGSPRIHAELAHGLRLQGRPSEAAAEARQAIRTDPRHPGANLELGLALLALGRPAEAVEPLRLAYRRSPGDQQVRLALAEAFGATGELDAARSLVAHLPETAPAEAWMISGRLELLGDSPIEPGRAKAAAARLLRARNLGLLDASLPLWLARAYEGAGEPARAVEAYDDFLRSSPRDSDQADTAALHRAHCRLQAGDRLGAIQDFESLLGSRGPDRRILVPLAHAYHAAALFDEAGRTAEQLLSLDPQNRDGLEVLTAVARQTGAWSTAAVACREAAERSESDATLWLMASEASFAAGDLTQAATAVEKAMAGSDQAELLRRAGHILIGLGRAEDATQALQRSAAATPDDPEVWIELADVADAAGDPQAAVAALQRASELRPWDVDVHARRAALLSAAARPSESVAAWKKALELAPNDVRIQQATAKGLMTAGEIKVGLALFTKALQAHPDEPDLLAEAGLAMLRHGSAEDAVDLLQRAATVRPTAGNLAALGEAWLRLGHPERAAEVLSRATMQAGAPPRAWALSAEAAAAVGNLAAAEAAILEARRPDVVAAEDRLALARAELRLAHWSDALTALTPILSSGGPDELASLAAVILRILEARWLFGEAGRAARHAPPAGVPSESLVAWLEAFVGESLQSPAGRRTLAARLSLTRSHEDEDALAVLTGSIDSVDRETLEAVALAHLRRNEPDQALAVLRRIDPGSLGSRWQALLAGLAHLAAGNPSLARQAFGEASDEAGLHPLAQALLARAHLAQGYSESAVTALNLALGRWSAEPEWHAMLAELYASGDDLDAALPHLQEATELEPGRIDWRLAYARTLRQAGHVREALVAYERLLPLTPSDSQIWQEAGSLALAAADPTRAEAMFERAASLAPDDPRPLVGQAKAALLAGKLREARLRAEAALQTGGEQPDALQCLAEIVARQGEPERAIAFLDRAHAVPHDAAELRRVRTRLLIDVGRAQQAVHELREHLAEHPDDDEAWPTLADALEATDDYPAAGQALEAALRLRPRSAELNVRLARVERKSGQLDHALDLLRQAEAIDPMQPELALEQGHVYEARRELDHALDAYCRSTEVNPRSPEAFRRAGHMFKSLKAYAEAEAMLQQAADLDPTDTATLQQLAAVRALELVHGGTYRMAVNP